MSRRLGRDSAFEDHGLHTLKGIEGAWRLFTVRQDGTTQIGAVV